MTIEFDPKRTTPERLAAVIADLGYKVEAVEPSRAAVAAKPSKPRKAPVPKNAPKFFRDAFEAARRVDRPIVVDFWAAWCGPCLQLKQVTFHDETVAKLLVKVQLVFVDLDDYPGLGDAYGVDAVPDVYFVDRGGMIVDRLHNFEPPKAFADRLRKLLGVENVESNTKQTARP